MAAVPPQLLRGLSTPSITDKVSALVPKYREEFKQLKDKMGTKSLGEYTVAQVATSAHTAAENRRRYQPLRSASARLTASSPVLWLL